MFTKGNPWKDNISSIMLCIGCKIFKALLFNLFQALQQQLNSSTLLENEASYHYQPQPHFYGRYSSPGPKREAWRGLPDRLCGRHHRHVGWLLYHHSTLDYCQVGDEQSHHLHWRVWPYTTEDRGQCQSSHYGVPWAVWLRLYCAHFTTDKGSNIVVALQHEDRINCINHILNRVLQQSLEESALSQPHPHAHQGLQGSSVLHQDKQHSEPHGEECQTKLRLSLELHLYGPMHTDATKKHKAEKVRTTKSQTFERQNILAIIICF